MHAAPTVSIVVPTFNGRAHLGATLGSILGQSFTDFELIVVDDGSTDGTGAWLRQDWAGEPRLRVLTRPNGGIARARNTGLEQARGALVAVTDHDDLWHPQRLAHQVRWLQASPADVGVVYGEFRAWDGQAEPAFAEPLHWPPREVPELSGWIYHQLLLTNWVLFSTALFRREVFAAVGHFDPELPPADDWDMVLRISRRWRLLKQPEVVALYRQHAGQTSRRVVAADPQTRLRESMLLRYGPVGPDGRACDPAQLRERRLRAHLAHAAAHAGAHGAARPGARAAAPGAAAPAGGGSLAVAWQSLRQALALAPADARVWRGLAALLAAALRR